MPGAIGNGHGGAVVPELGVIGQRLRDPAVSLDPFFTREIAVHGLSQQGMPEAVLATVTRGQEHAVIDRLAKATDDLRTGLRRDGRQQDRVEPAANDSGLLDDIAGRVVELVESGAKYVVQRRWQPLFVVEG